MSYEEEDTCHMRSDWYLVNSAHMYMYTYMSIYM